MEKRKTIEIQAGTIVDHISKHAFKDKQLKFPEMWFRMINIILIVMIVLFVLDIIFELKENNKIGNLNPSLRDEKIRLILSGIHAIGILAWPILWSTLIGYRALIQFPILLFGFTWPIIISLIDLYSMSVSGQSVKGKSLFSIGNLQADAQSLITIAFAIGTLLMTLQVGKYSQATTPLLLYALLFCIAFIIPSIAIERESDAGYVFGDMQRIAFNYAMGFVITGISFNILFKLVSNKFQGLKHFVSNPCD